MVALSWSESGNQLVTTSKTCLVAGLLFCLQAQFGRTNPNSSRYLLHRLALLLVESFHLSGPAPHEIGLHRLVQEDLLAFLADHDTEWLLEHFGEMVHRDVFSQGTRRNRECTRRDQDRLCQQCSRRVVKLYAIEAWQPVLVAGHACRRFRFAGASEGPPRISQ